MAEFRIEQHLTGRDGLIEEFEKGLALKVQHEPGACRPCRENEDVNQIPFPGCRGNISGRHPTSRVGNLCKCTVVWADEGDNA